MVENLKEAMKINRKKARETIYNNTDGYKKKVYWDNSLQSWVVVDNKIARSILTSSNYSADRKGEFIDQIDATQKQKNVLKEFYTNW
ncbi:cytochrome, partial [Ralstonia insidiosa]|nr:cytochrome [Ralstonia insidiosa]